MLVPPTTNHVPLIATAANVPTEQAARDNKIRQPIVATSRLDKVHAERKSNENDKQRRRNAWDPNEHPNYEDTSDDTLAIEEEESSELDRLFQLLSIASYSDEQGKGYVIRFKLPQKVLAEALKEGAMVKRRQVIRFHYGHAVSPNTPSDVIAVL